MAKDYLVKILEERREELLDIKSKLNKIFYAPTVDNTKEKIINKTTVTTNRLEEYIDKMELVDKELAKVEKSISKRLSEIKGE